MEINASASRFVSEYANQTIRVYLYFAIGFLVPFTIGHPQELVGVVVNATLIVAALQLDSYKEVIPLLFAPSLGVLARGLIFGPYTPFLAIMLPFIWIGNALLVVGIRELIANRNQNYWISLGASSLAKSGFLFGSAFALVSLSIVPAIFLMTMGATQLITALAGGCLAFGIVKLGYLTKTN